MLMQGDMNKVLTQVNEILAGAFKRIEALEDKLQAIENPSYTVDSTCAVAPKKRGRPPGSKNKMKMAA